MAVTEIKYNGSTIASLLHGQTATLKCKGDHVKMLSDIEVEVAERREGPLHITENGTYDAVYETATVTWDENTAYDFTVDFEGIPLRVKKLEGFTVPEDVRYLTCSDYAVTAVLPDIGAEAIPLKELEIVDAGYAYLPDALMYAVVWIKDASAFNDTIGEELFEDNTVYVSDMLWVLAEGELEGCALTLTAPGKKLDGISSVTVDVPIPDGYVVPEGTKEITENGTHDVSGYAEAVVNVESSGGLAINGVIEQYKVNAGATVNAGDFVEFVNKWGSNNIFDDTSMVSYASACKLGTNSVFVAYRYYDGSIYHLMGKILILEGTTITVGEGATIDSSVSGFPIHPTALTDSKVFLAYRYYDGSAYYLMGNICTIEGMSITVGTATTFESSDNSSSYSYKGFTALTDSKVFVAYSRYDGTTYYLMGSVCTIDGTQITKVAEVTIESGSSSYYPISPVALTDSKVFLLAADICYVCSIVGSSIVVGNKGNSRGTYDSDGKAVCRSVVALSNSKVLTTYQSHRSYYNYYLRARVHTIDGTTITTGSEQTLASSPHSYDDEYFVDAPSIVALTDSKVFATYQFRSRSSPTYSVYGIVSTINGTSLSNGTSVLLCSSSTSYSSTPVVAFSDDSVFVLCCGAISTYIGATVEDKTITVNTESEGIGTYIQPATSRLHNVGIAATSGTEGETVDVYVVG